ncbi:hypothetical protein [Natronoglycomyces albus]|uniref:Multidrug resistance protein MdtA-like C-terminal permuted SH3 domain-containing protein n=1 Tax=Natronoglycomyces albus TaxID=2811108 RepID=A0A895XRE5_9ACTN|nr:hypothetical protein [Natronoglycomyces albus]QSB04178.1 hypothetical protein JQS30_10170 [Natronoglycomyces albus]
MLRKSLLAAGLVALLLAATGVTWWIASEARTPEQRSLDSEPPPDSVITAEVVAGPLLEEMELPGTVVRESTTTVSAPQEGAIVTELGVESGDTIETGDVVAELNGRPLIALPGSFRSYRDLSEGDEGRDVEQLQQALAVLYGGDVTGYFGPNTANFVDQLYQRNGYSPLEGDPVEEVGPTEEGEEPPTPEPSVLVPQAELLFLPTLPAVVGEVLANIDDDAGDLVTIVSGDWHVESSLRGADTQQIPADAAATGDGETDLVFVGTRGETTEEGEVRNIAVFGFSDEPEFDEGETVTVTVELARSESETVVVPATALWERSNGTTVVTVLEDGELRDVEVDIDLSHRGRTSVVAETGLAPGDLVVVGRDR